MLMPYVYTSFLRNPTTVRVKNMVLLFYHLKLIFFCLRTNTVSMPMIAITFCFSQLYMHIDILHSKNNKFSHTHTHTPIVSPLKILIHQPQLWLYGILSCSFCIVFDPYILRDPFTCITWTQKGELFYKKNLIMCCTEEKKPYRSGMA